MPTSKFFWLLLLILFGATFWWAGGQTVWPDKTGSSSHPGSEFRQKVSGPYDRLYRVIALKSAVAAKLDKTNYIPLTAIPPTMQQAIIAIEDNRFYNHPGFDVEALLRASLVNLQTGKVQEGGSTITQQLAKNLFLTQEQSMNRKIEEFILAVDLEARYSKDEILEMYLNSIYFGSGTYGLGEAAQVYFGKAPANLTLAEAAMLAGLPNAPSLTSPYVDFSAAKQRQLLVLKAMERYGYITPELLVQTKNEPIRLVR